MKNFLIKLILFYQQNISRRTRPKCRFFPTCSNYALEAIERFGVFKGGFLSFYRLLRCNPFSRGGCDPVPSGKKQ